jgi:glutathione S-transferase
MQPPHASIEVTAYGWMPQMARGFVKDMRVRWALEEICLPYHVRLVGGARGQKSPEHLADQPFGQVHVYQEEGLTLFESGAILIHLGDKDARLLPRDPVGRAGAIGWAVAALNSVEPTMEMLFVTGMVSDGFLRNKSGWRNAASLAVAPALAQINPTRSQPTALRQLRL